MYAIQPVRASAVLTTSYVAGTIIGLPGQPSENNYKNNQTVLMFDYTDGSLTSAEFKVESAFELLWDLAYDGQSANFTAGLVVTGGTSKATGLIVSDTDGGATGTLVIRIISMGINGTGFIDNEALTDSSTGVAVVNGAVNPNVKVGTFTAPSDASFYQETFSSITAGTDTLSVGEHTLVADKRQYFLLNSKFQYHRVSVKGTGTVTNSLLKVDALVGIT